MIRRLVTNPAVVVLVVLAVLAALAVDWGIDTTLATQSMSWTGEPSEEQLLALRISQIANILPAPGVLVGVLSVLGILAIAAVTRSTMMRSSSRRATGSSDS
jgi:hypothetical protein